MRKTRNHWLMAGIEVLQTEGRGALRIERLCQDLQLTKGSFYHHFQNLEDYETVLLGFYQQITTLDIIAQLERITDPRERLRALVRFITLYDPALEVVFRGWAREDPRVAAVQQQLEQTRENYVLGLIQQLVEDPEQARLLARAFYWMYVGSQQAFMPHDPQEKLQIHLMMLDRLGL